MDSQSVRSLARSTRSLTSANLLNRATSANGSQADRKSVSYVSTASKFNQRKSSASQAGKVSEHSRLRRKAIHTKNIMEVVNKLDEHELERVSEMLRQSEKEAQEAEGDFEEYPDQQEEGVRMVEVDENGDPVDYAEEELEEVVSLPGDIAVSRKSVAASRTSSAVAID
jgi:hypothetical protein